MMIATLPCLKEIQNKKGHRFLDALTSGRQDSNLRPPGPKPGALPACATSRRGAKLTIKLLSFRIFKKKNKMSPQKLSRVAVLLTALIVSSCDSGEKPSLVQPSNTPAVPAANQPITSAPNAAGTGTQAIPLQESRAAMNPKHGMPGHRCDIPEGAPLNGTPPPARNNPSVQNAPAPQLNQAPTPSTQAGIKLNPKHGEPGHRCDLQVGAQLN